MEKLKTIRKSNGVSIIALLLIILVLIGLIAFGIKFALDGKIFDLARKARTGSEHPYKAEIIENIGTDDNDNPQTQEEIH